LYKALRIVYLYLSNKKEIKLNYVSIYILSTYFQYIRFNALLYYMYLLMCKYMHIYLSFIYKKALRYV